MIIAMLVVLNILFSVTSSNDIISNDINLKFNYASAGPIGEWWDRPDYDCVEMDCTCEIGVPGASETRYGHYDNCEDMGAGEGSVAHCWNCDMGCDCW